MPSAVVPSATSSTQQASSSAASSSSTSSSPPLTAADAAAAAATNAAADVPSAASAASTLTTNGQAMAVAASSSSSAPISSSTSASAATANADDDVDEKPKDYTKEEDTAFSDDEDIDPGDSIGGAKKAREDHLIEEKSSLFASQDKSASFPAFGFPYPYLAAYPYGFTSLYGDLAAGYKAIRPGAPPPPFSYPLPPHAQYPYSAVITPELAAWQAQMYHRSGSPYSPITSANINPMSRFSPGLLGHPLAAAAAAQAGLSPGAAEHSALAAAASAAASAGSGSQRPVKREYEHQDNKDSPNKRKEPHIKKPLNAFMLYMKEMRPVVQAECTLKESAAINQILGRRWHGLSREEQAKYYEKARVERQKHMQMYPHWNARDNYRFGLKKKKRKRDKADDPAASMKKCRARYGLDQQDLWCKPCRRKKKCTRVQAYLDSKAAELQRQGGAMGVNGSAGLHPGAITGHEGNNNIGKGQDMNGHMINSDGEDDDDDDEDDDSDSQTPDSNGMAADRERGNGGGSLGSGTSELSLTSPAGFSSIPSLGSPAGSIASPSTPSATSTTQPQSAFSEAGSRASLDLLRNYYRPPLSSSSGATPSTAAPSFGGPFNHSSHLAAVAVAAASHHPHLHPPPHVGTDPRDSKHPLSVMQLTGSGPASTASLMNGVPPLESPFGHSPHHHHLAAAAMAAAAANEAGKRTILGMT